MNILNLMISPEIILLIKWLAFTLSWLFWADFSSVFCEQVCKKLNPGRNLQENIEKYLQNS